MQPLLGDLNHEEFWILHLNRSNKNNKENQAKSRRYYRNCNRCKNDNEKKQY